MPEKTAKTQTKLEPTDILAAEYNYIAQTAFQANEDRARVLSYYLVTVGSLVGAILSAQLTMGKWIHLAFAGLFVLLTVFGIITLRQLVQLRRAWTKSIMAMGEVKEFILKRHPDLKPALPWRLEHIPEVKTYSITYLQALQVALLAAVTAGCTAYFLTMRLGLIAIAIGLLTVLVTGVLQIDYFRKEFQKISAGEN